MYARSLIVLGAVKVLGVLGDNVFQLAQQAIPEAFGVGLAAATVACNHDISYRGAPEPTQAPNVPFGELVKRQAAPTTVCGLLSASPQLSYTCSSGYVCGFATRDRNAFGCCSSYLGSGSVTGCYFPTTCYDYSVATTMSCASSDFPCVWSTQYCISSAYPYCGKFVEAGLTAWDCFKTPSLSVALIPVTDGGSVAGSTTPAASTTGTVASSILGSISSARSSSAMSITSSKAAVSSSVTSSNIQYDTSDFGDPLTRTQTQQTAQTVAITTPTSTSSKGMGVSVEPAGQTWLAFLLSFLLAL